MNPSLSPGNAGGSRRLEERIEKLRDEIKRLKGIERDLQRAPDQQISQTDPDARSMATSGRGSGTVGYNVQIAVEPKHHLIVAEEVTSVGNDRAQLATMATKARDAMDSKELTAVADRGYYRDCDPDVTPEWNSKAI